MEEISGTGSSGRIGSSPIYGLSVTYEYNVNGQVYRSDKVGFTETYDNFSGNYRDSIIERLRIVDETRTPLTVWVNPESPRQAVIERSLPVDSSIFSAFILMFPCGLATLVIMTFFCSLICRWNGENHEHAAKKFVFPLWAILHGSLALPIIALAPASSIGLGSSFVLGLFLLLMAVGVLSLLRAINVVSPRTTGAVSRNAA